MKTAMTVRLLRVPLLALSVVTLYVPARADIPVTLFASGFVQPVGIDVQSGTGKLVVSVNHPTGVPYGFELVNPDGTHSHFGTVSGLTDEVYVRTVRCDMGGGWTRGDIFVGTGVPGVIAKMSADGNTIVNPWVTLPGEIGLLRGGMAFDTTGVFNGDMLITTETGSIWRVTSAGVPTKLADVGQGVHLEGVTAIPDDAVKYGPWAGKLLTCGEDTGMMYTVSPAGGGYTTWDLGLNSLTPRFVFAGEEVHVIPSGAAAYVVESDSGNVWTASAANLAPYVGDILLSEENPSRLWTIHWNGSTFDVTHQADVPGKYIEKMTFAEVCVPQSCNGRMTGGGSIFTTAGDSPGGGQRVTHGFNIRCDATDPRQTLEVNWKDAAGKEHAFHMLDLTWALCLDDPNIAPNNPPAGFDTFIGKGAGKYDGVDGATIEFTFTDAGEPGTGDTAAYLIRDVDGNVVLSVSVKFLTKGNHQAHKV